MFARPWVHEELEVLDGRGATLVASRPVDSRPVASRPVAARPRTAPVKPTAKPAPKATAKATLADAKRRLARLESKAPAKPSPADQRRADAVALGLRCAGLSETKITAHLAAKGLPPASTRRSLR